MTDTDWRIAGGIGVSEPIPDDAQVITQGIGFPLRQVDNVPPQESGDFYNDIVAEGLFMQWMGNWRAGIYYGKGSYVRDGLWTMVANKLTIDPASPVDIGTATFANGWTNPPPPPTDAMNTSQISATQIYTFTSAGYIRQLRVWATDLSPDVTYRVVAVNITDPEKPISSVFENPVLTLDDWNTIAVLDTLVAVGTVLSVTLETLNSGATTNISGGWTYFGPTQTGAPPAMNWTHDNQRTTFRIDKIDLDGTDRGTELEGVIQDSIITLVQTSNVGLTTTYRVSGVVDAGTYMNYAVVLQDETGGGPKPGEVTTIDIDVPIALPTHYAEETAYWPTNDPSWGTVTSKLEFDSVDQAVADSAFGVDIQFQEALASPDWDIITSP